MAERHDGSMLHDGDASRRVRRAAPGEQRPRTTLPEDRFDRLPRRPRVGVHRLVARPRRFWQYLVASLLAIAVLTGAGILAMQSIGTSVPSLIDQEDSGASTEQQVKPVIDPEASIAVLNGTETPGLEASVGQVIADNGWGQIGFTEVAATSDVQISAVFYASPEDEAAALGLAKELGGVSTYLNDEYSRYGVRLVVLLGSDYAGPGLP